MNRALDYHSERHNVVASNIANVDTPSFTPLELVRPDERTGPVGPSLPLAKTDGQHLNGTGIGGENEFFIEPDQLAPAGGDGNSVSLEYEMSKLAANDVRYETVVQMVRRKLGLLGYAASDTTRG